VRRRIRSVPWWDLFLLLLPIALDGITHAISDLSGIGLGFRDTNSWLAALIDYRFLSSFYAGDAMGSFNSLARLITALRFHMSFEKRRKEPSRLYIINTGMKSYA
jgi:hypothetical protein